MSPTDPPLLSYSDDPDFRAWLVRCDAILVRIYGVGVFDLPDACWYDSYDGGLTPASAVRSFCEDGAFD